MYDEGNGLMLSEQQIQSYDFEYIRLGLSSILYLSSLRILISDVSQFIETSHTQKCLG